MKGKTFLYVYAFLFIVIFSGNLLSNESEYYSICSLSHKFGNKYNFKVNTTLRFKRGKNYYRKFYVGITKSFGKHLYSGVYFGQKFIEKTKWEKKPFLFHELSYGMKVGVKVKISDRNRIEYFIRNNEIRYRNMIKLQYSLAKKLKIWSADEVKYFFKEKMVKKNEFFIGIILKTRDFLFFNVFYDYKIEKVTEVWKVSNVFGFKILFFI